MADVAQELTRVRVDFNARSRGGMVRARLLDGMSITEGDRVVAFDPGEDLVADAAVAEVDHARGLVFLDVDWGSFEDSEGTHPQGVQFGASATTVIVAGVINQTWGVELPAESDALVFLAP